MDRRYEIDHSAVASDIIDGEAIILHHFTGDYFSTDGTGAVVWKWIGEARSRGQILRALEAKFPESSPSIPAALEAFLADLLSHELIRESVRAAGADSGALPPEALPGDAFSPPLLHVYSDMRGVLLVDPIHEVEESAGWPVPRRADAKP